mgnify:CR=1 FL=1
MMLTTDAAAYIEHLIPARHPELQAMEAHGRELGFPIIGPVCGHLCYQVARMIGARRIFELGSGFGYSTAWFAQAVRENGQNSTDVLLPSDNTVAAYWITNPDNTYINNVAAGSDANGFWMSLPEHPNGAFKDSEESLATWPRVSSAGPTLRCSARTRSTCQADCRAASAC